VYARLTSGERRSSREEARPRYWVCWGTACGCWQFFVDGGEPRRLRAARFASSSEPWKLDRQSTNAI